MIILFLLLFTYSCIISIILKLKMIEISKLKKSFPSNTDLKLIKALNSGDLTESDLNEMGILKKLKEPKILNDEEKEKSRDWLYELESKIKIILDNPNNLLNWNHIRKTSVIINTKPLNISSNIHFDKLKIFYSNLMGKYVNDEKELYYEDNDRLYCYNLHVPLIEFIDKEYEKFK